MSKASKLARAQKNVPGFSQRILTKANKIINTTTTTGPLSKYINTSGPVNGTDGGEGTFFLVEEAEDIGTGENSFTSDSHRPTPGIGMLIDDLTLKSTSSYVKLQVSISGDTNNVNIGPGFKIQKSINGSWTDLSVADVYPGPTDDSKRVEVMFAGSHAFNERNLESISYSIIDTSPGTLTPQYRVVVHIYYTTGMFFLLNREYSSDNAGAGIGTNTSDLYGLHRTVSTFTAEEIINY